VLPGSLGGRSRAGGSGVYHGLVDLRCEIEPPDRLVVHLRDADQEATIAVKEARAGATTLLRALDAAIDDGYGECFWPADPGQYWWVFKRDADSLETIAMWTRGGVTGWEHVFRATDAAAHIRGRMHADLDPLAGPR
jgi:hypothetical protein